MTRLLIVGARLGTRSDAAPTCLRIHAGRIEEIGPTLARRPDERRLDAGGGALLPGLNDHHVHLMATAAALRSIPCGPPAVRNEAALIEGLRAAIDDAAQSAWLRGVGYHESVAGELDRDRLDAWVPDRPLRVQHRSGALWMLNSAALAAIGLGNDRAQTGVELDAEGELPAGLERDAEGRVNGRLFRLDGWLRERLPEPAPLDLATVGARFLAAGVTGLCDATPSNGATEAAALQAAAERGDLRQRLRVMGGAGLAASRHPRITHAERKIVLDESRLPDPDALSDTIGAAHADRRAVAIHCVTRSELVMAIHGLRAAGPLPGDRIEHASVTPPELLAALHALGVRVVTQPGFVLERGDSYLQEVEARDRPWLYRCRGFLDAGVPLAAGTDAPFGEPDPWRAMRAAVERQTAAGRRLAVDEAVSPEAALALFTSPLEAPGAPAATIAVGQSADLCLLALPWRRAAADLDRRHVAVTIVDGSIAFEA